MALHDYLKYMGEGGIDLLSPFRPPLEPRTGLRLKRKRLEAERRRAVSPGEQTIFDTRTRQIQAQEYLQEETARRAALPISERATEYLPEERVPGGLTLPPEPSPPLDIMGDIPEVLLKEARARRFLGAQAAGEDAPASRFYGPGGIPTPDVPPEGLGLEGEGYLDYLRRVGTGGGSYYARAGGTTLTNIPGIRQTRPPVEKPWYARTLTKEEGKRRDVLTTGIVEERRRFFDPKERKKAAFMAREKMKMLERDLAPRGTKRYKERLAEIERATKTEISGTRFAEIKELAGIKAAGKIKPGQISQREKIELTGEAARTSIKIIREKDLDAKLDAAEIAAMNDVLKAFHANKESLEYKRWQKAKKEKWINKETGSPYTDSELYDLIIVTGAPV